MGLSWRPSLPPHMRGNSTQSFQNLPIRLPHQRLPSIPTNYDPGRQIAVKHADQVSKRTRSPPHSPPNVASFEKSALGLRESKRYDRKILTANFVSLYFNKHKECQWKGLLERCRISYFFSYSNYISCKGFC